MQPQPSMLPAQVRVPPDQTPLLLTKDPEAGERREAKEYDDKPVAFCESAILCVLFSFIAALIVVIVILVVEAATGQAEGVPAWFVGFIIFFIVLVILLLCVFSTTILQTRYDRRNNRIYAPNGLAAGAGDVCLGCAYCFRTLVLLDN